MNFSTLATQYIRFATVRGAAAKTAETYQLAFDQYVTFLRTQGHEDSLRHFTPEQIEAFVDHLKGAGLKASSIHVKLAALQSLGEYGKKTKAGKGYILDENPLDRVFRPKRQKPPEKYLYAAELKQLLAVEAPSHQRLVVELLVDTALRANELASATVGDLTLDGDRILLAVRVKGGKPRTITLGSRVGAILVESLKIREAGPTDPLLVNDRGERYTRASISELVRRLAVRAGLTRFTVRAHVLRHSVATLASATGAEVPAIAAMLNHAGLGTVQRYIHRHDAVDAAREAVREALR